jgi:hypothetical protein
VGELLTIGGFVASSVTALRTTKHWKQHYYGHYQPTLQAIQQFVKESQLDTQFTNHWRNNQKNSQWMIGNLIILSRIQKLMIRTTHQSLPERAAWTVKPHTTNSDDTYHHQQQQEQPTPNFIPTVPQAQRYAKFATAAYGDAMIRAAQLDVTGRWYDTLLRSTGTRQVYTDDTSLHKYTRLAEHVNLPNTHNDIIVRDIEYNGNHKHLRHFVAIDHQQKEIILSIRGTYNIGEIVVDIAAFTTPFGTDSNNNHGNTTTTTTTISGEAHSEMAKQAKLIWEVTGPTILKLWKDHPHYTLVLTGHSLGAGTASLLHLWLHEGISNSSGSGTTATSTTSSSRSIPTSGSIRCVVFASPPVYYNPQPSASIQHAMQQCVNFVQGYDMVPFLSIDSMRHLLSGLEWISEHTQTLSYWERSQLIGGFQTMDDTWVEAVQALPRPTPLPGAPPLIIPAATNIWLLPSSQVGNKNSTDGTTTTTSTTEYDDDDSVYYPYFCDSYKMATQVGIQVDWNMFQDHFPPRYEHALHYLSPDIHNNHWGY